MLDIFQVVSIIILSTIYRSTKMNYKMTHSNKYKKK